MSPKKVNPIAVLAELDEIFAWKPPSLLQSPEFSSLCPELTLPARTFYDKHVDDRLSLRTVKPLASLQDDISNVASLHLTRFLERRPSVDRPNLGDWSLWQPAEGPIDADATEVAAFYTRSTSELSRRLANAIFLMPKTTDWPTGFIWCRSGEAVEEAIEEGSRSAPSAKRVARDENYGLLFPIKDGQLNFSKEEFDCMEPEMIMNLEMVVSHSSFMGSWQILAVSSEARMLLTELGRATLQSSFPYKRCGTLNYSSNLTTILRKVDASATPWRVPTPDPNDAGTSSATVSSLRRSTRLKPSPGVSSSPVKTASKLKRTPGSPTLVTPAAKRRPKSTAHPFSELTVESLLQLGWCRALRTDATVIVFSCGNLERIGIRHRETQTIYLSDLIDATNCEDGYVKLHVGLYITIIQDTIDRIIQSTAEDPGGDPKTGEKRPSDDAASGKRKRQKTSHPGHSDPDVESALSIAGTRNLALLHMQYDIYNSPTPASFIRSAPPLSNVLPDLPFTQPPVKRRYAEHEYITLTLTSEIAAGATGVVHAATLHVVAPEGTTLLENVVVKIAFLAEQQKRMVHEYEVYRRLTRSDVQGIPKVYGMFDDLEGGAIALVMSHCGSCLSALQPDPAVALSVLSEQRAHFIAILENIHRAGVHHHDIRPENLMLTEAGEAAIIDFDRANFDPTSGRKQREMERLIAILDGAYYDSDMGSPRTTRTLRSDDGNE
ncbi:hypothetical protein C8R47DRAFT_810437 [Mycena vitilis]|nr:hypothetical protein C8R47DRAFT_810437 [Mycena vitilis]